MSLVILFQRINSNRLYYFYIKKFRGADTGVFKNLFGGSNSSIVGIEFRSDRVAIVVRDAKSDLPSITKVSFLKIDGIVDAKNRLKVWVQQNKLANALTNIVLNPSDYQILLVEPPDVAEKELKSAIRWRLKDLLNIPVDQAAIDVFSLPADGTKANRKMVYVVAAETKRIQSLVGLIKESGLNLESIDISELAVRNIAKELICDDGSERGIAVARIQQGIGSVYIYREGNMYLSRTFSLNYNGGLLDELPEDTLALELQRSLDYYERQMGQAPPSVVYICGDNVTDGKIGPTFRASLAVHVQVLDPSAIVHLPDDIDIEDLKQCLGALGGTLRMKEVI